MAFDFYIKTKKFFKILPIRPKVTCHILFKIWHNSTEKQKKEEFFYEKNH